MKTNQSVIAKYAVLLFAALGLTAAWGGDARLNIGDSTHWTLDEYGVIKVQDSYKYYDGGSTTIDVEGVLEYSVVGSGVTNSTVVSKYEGLKTAHGWQGTETKGEFVEFFVDGFELGCDVWARYVATYTGHISGTKTYAEEVKSTAGIISMECGWRNDPDKVFMISGKIAGSEVSSIKAVYNIVSSPIGEYTEIESPAYTNTVQVGSSDTTYKIEVPYTDSDVTLVWSLYMCMSDGTERLYKSDGETVFNRNRIESSAIWYTWTGEGRDNKWTNPENWEESIWRSYYGYPGFYANCGSPVWWSYYTSKAIFKGSVSIDLDGGSFRLWDQDDDDSNIPFRAFAFEKEDSEQMTVEFTNGTIRIFSPERSFLGDNGVTMIFSDVVLKIFDEFHYEYNDDGTPDMAARTEDNLGPVGFAANSTVVFSGSNKQLFDYAPFSGSANSKVVFRDGVTLSGYSTSASIASTHTVEISNAVWVVTATAANGVAGLVRLRDGADRQAQLMCRASATSTTYYNLKTGTAYDIKIPARGHSAASVIAKGASDATACSFVLDVTDFNNAARVPLIQFTEATLSDNTIASMTNTLNSANALTVYATGQSDNAKTARLRNARLEWDESAKILYYAQERPLRGMRVIVR